MAWLYELRLIRLFELYLALIFLVSMVLRARQYQAVLRLIWAVPGRWPRLLLLVRQYRHIFLTWGTVLPLAASLVLLLAQMVATRLIWPQANLTLARVLELWPAVPFVVVTGIAMVGFDVYSTILVGEVDQKEMEQYFDQAEYWLRSWAAPVVSFFTLGYVNPRKMVAAEVSAALLSASEMLNSTLWWVATQAGLRILFGLSLWLTYALQGGIERLIR